MNIKWLVGSLGMLAVVLIGWTALSTLLLPNISTSAAVRVSTSRKVASSTIKAPSTIKTRSIATSYTLADIAKHNSERSCWAAINSKVYDLTNWINQHPGGPDRILALCGTDGSAAFNGQHGTQARPASELASFYIAPLAK